MDFLRKGAQAAKNLAAQVKEAVDESSTSTGFSISGSGAAGDKDFEVCVRQFMTLNTSLKQIGGKAQELIKAIRAQGQSSFILSELLEGTCEIEFGEESHWSNAAMSLRNINQEVDGKFNVQLTSLLQRDILDRIAAELETNNEVKAIIDQRKALAEAPRDRADEAVQKIATVIRRRNMLLAHCVTVLMSHQYNYYPRLSEKYQTLRPLVAESKQLLDGGAASTSPIASASPSRSAPSSEQQQQQQQQAPAPAKPVKPAPSPPADNPVPTQPPPPVPVSAKPPQEKPTPPLQAQPATSPSPEPVDLLGLDTEPAAPVQKPTPQKPANAPPAAPPTTGDLLDGLFGDSSAPPRVPVAGPFKKQGSFKGAKTDDLFPEIGAGKRSDNWSPTKPDHRAKDTGDLLDFGTTPSRESSDPLGDLFGPLDSGGKRRSGASKKDLLHGLVDGGGSGGGAAVSDPTRVNGDDEPLKVPIKARPRQEGDFQGEGTDRDQLKRQFEQHLQEKAQAAADEMRRIEDEKKAYEDLKFESQDRIQEKLISWAGPKHSRKNLRAMLSTFDMVLWDSAKAKWEKKGLHELLMPEQVKKIHRKAVLLVHPDKVRRESDEVQLLAEEVQGVLHTALDEFRKKEPC
mmetsp:Transcript_44428/g.90660  ORF Transcript_44428/g.90660 Transcript_44428/m.90660 type:complete len:628 (-) Transcript_44428:260-2143(-)